MASQLDKVKDIIEEIRKKTQNGLPITPYDREANQVSLDRREKIYKAQDKLRFFLNEFETYCTFIEESTLDTIFSSLNKILLSINNISVLPLNNYEKLEQKENILLTEIMSLPNILSLPFYNNGSINVPAINNLILHINETFLLFKDLNIDLILKEANYEELNQIIQSMLAIHNEHILSPESKSFPKLILEAYKILNFVSDKSKRIQLNDSIEKLEDTTIKMKNRVGLAGNSSLFNSFKDEADSFKWKIIIYNTAILSILTIVLTSLSLLIFIMIFTPGFKFIKDYHFYGFYISFFFFISLLLAYLIKERSRLISHQYYCKITYLELLAMIPFTTEIEDSVKVDDLKVRLAERYFLGPNRILNNTEHTDSMTTSKLSEIIKLVQEVKSAIK